MNRVIFLLCLILVVGCARSNNSVSTVALKEDARILWQNYAGNVQANYVVNDLPDVSVQVNASIEGNVYSAPVIFKDQNGVQSVLVLTRIGTVLALVKYTIEGNALVKDGAFITSPLQSDENYYNHHQIALVEEEDQVYVYVAHKNGIAKYNAYEGGSSVASYDSGTDSVFRLLVDGNIVYAQSASALLKLNTDLTESASVEADFSFDSEDRSLPLVISGETIYAVSGSNIYSVNIDSFNSTNSYEIETTAGSIFPDITVGEGHRLDDVISDVRIGSIAATPGKGVIYSTIRTENWLYVNPSELLEIYKDYIEQMGHYVFVFRHQFRTTEFYTIGDDTAQQLINTMMKNCYPKHQTAIGDSGYTGLVVLDKKVLFPGSSTSMFSKQNCESDNIVASSIFTTAFGNVNEFELTTGRGAKGQYFSHLTKEDSSKYSNINWNKVPRFIVSDGKQTLSILNVSQNLQGITNNNMLPDISIDFYSFFSFTYKNNKSWADYFSSNTNSPGNSSDLTAFNTEVQLGNERSLSLSDQNVAVTSVAVGDKAIVMVGKNNSNTILYLVK